MKWVAENFQILQLGLTLVTFEEGLKTYPFNIYLFPRRPAGHVQDRVLSMQLGCVLFNAEHGMDWNKWIREGVNYTTIEQYDEVRGASTKEIISKLSHDYQKVANDIITDMEEVNFGKEGKSKVIKNCPLYNNTVRKIFNGRIREQNYPLELSIDNSPQGDVIKITKVSREEHRKRTSAADE